MFTPEEKKALAELQGGDYKTRYETTIKEVDGGFIITHVVAYAREDEMIGTTREQFVCSDPYCVTEAISNLYGDRTDDDPIPVYESKPHVGAGYSQMPGQPDDADLKVPGGITAGQASAELLAPSGKAVPHRPDRDAQQAAIEASRQQQAAPPVFDAYDSVGRVA